MQRWMMVAVLGLLLMTVGCDQLSTTPTLYIDNTFTVEELGHVLHGPEQWEAQVSDFHFNIVLVSHAEAMGYAKSLDKDTITFVRVNDEYDHDCPDIGNVRQLLADHHDNAITWKSGWNGSAMTCFNVREMNKERDTGKDPHSWDSSPVHELGHAYGLQHHDDGKPAVMYPHADIDLQPAILQCSDLEQYSKLHNWVIPLGACG